MKTSLKTVQKHTICEVREGKNDNELIFYGFGEFGENEQNVSAIKWYTDIHQIEVVCGVVAEFPARPGFPSGWFLAGYHWEETGERVYWPEVYATKYDATYPADRHAERFAEFAREDSARFYEMQEAENNFEEAKAELRLILPARNVNRKLRDCVLERIEKYNDAREELKNKTWQYENPGK